MIILKRVTNVKVGNYCYLTLRICVNYLLIALVSLP